MQLLDLFNIITCFDDVVPLFIRAISSLNAPSELRLRFGFLVHFAFLLLERVAVLCDENFSLILSSGTDLVLVRCAPGLSTALALRPRIARGSGGAFCDSSIRI